MSSEKRTIKKGDTAYFVRPNYNFVKGGASLKGVPVESVGKVRVKVAGCFETHYRVQFSLDEIDMTPEAAIDRAVEKERGEVERAEKQLQMCKDRLAAIEALRKQLQ